MGREAAKEEGENYRKKGLRPGKRTVSHPGTGRPTGSMPTCTAQMAGGLMFFTWREKYTSTHATIRASTPCSRLCSLGHVYQAPDSVAHRGGPGQEMLTAQIRSFTHKHTPSSHPSKIFHDRERKQNPTTKTHRFHLAFLI